MIECGKVFGAAASTRNNDHVNVTSFIEVTNAGTNLKRRSLSLNLRGKNQNVCRMMTPPQDIQNIPQRRRLRRTHYPDAARRNRNPLPALRIEQSFRFQLGLELFKSNL